MRNVLAAAVFTAMFVSCAAQAEQICSQRSFEGSAFTVCRFDAKSEHIRLAWTDSNGKALRSFEKLRAALGKKSAKIRFATNAGMFETDGMPLGLYVENGKERRPLNMRTGTGNFYLKPNGVFSLDLHGALKIETSESFAARRDIPVWATQSGPMLVIDGALNPQVAPDGPSQNIRNGVGVRDHATAFFAISNDPVSFGKLARFLRDDLGCRDVLYLDGAISSLWAPSLRRMDAGPPLGPMVVVLDH